MGFVPDEFPRAVFVSVLGRVIIVRTGIMLLDAFGQIIRRADIESARLILKYINPEWTSSNFQTPRVGLEPTT